MDLAVHGPRTDPLGPDASPCSLPSARCNCRRSSPCASSSISQSRPPCALFAPSRDGNQRDAASTSSTKSMGWKGSSLLRNLFHKFIKRPYLNGHKPPRQSDAQTL